MDRTMNRAGCLAKGVAHGGQLGHELILLAKRAQMEGRITDEDWQKLPSTPEGMVMNLWFYRFWQEDSGKLI